MIVEIFGLILVAVFTGVFSGLLGIGGNMIAIPVLLVLFKHFIHIPDQTAMHMALCSGVVVMVFTTFSSVMTHKKNNNIDWGFYKCIALYMVAGAVLGAHCVLLINGKVLEKVFGIFLLFVSLKLLHSKMQQKNSKQEHHVVKLNVFVMAIIGILIGFKSGLLGIGGGLIIIPLMIHLGFSGPKISGTTSACSLTMALTSAITLLILNYGVDLGIKYSYGNIYIPAVLVMIPFTMIFAKVGAKLSTKFSNKTLSNIQLITVVILAIKMLA